ncbi:DEAD/DEAH box helicase [Clostridium chrysemydis]|uniref:DEAD/DEAH box helicase n=1 Tax=Clostridium chrysemydis TaxID=2665504 RepID=UPI0018845F75|nr:DEAD/DEAH box helicase [Clostridium chrysemydis]
MNFKDLNINDKLIKILNQNGITKPTPIQEESIPKILNGLDTICESQTGSGKTLAFLLPIMQNIDITNNSVQALIISPTRELALQISEEAEKLSEAFNTNVLSMYGGKDVGSQIKKLKKNIHIVIATPGRLIDHLKRESISLKGIKTIVLDEADQLLFMGFRNEVDSIMGEMPKKYQMLCFSATMDSKVKKLAYRYMNNPSLITIKKEEVTLTNIDQEVVKTTDRWKQASLFKVLEEDNPFMAIIFCRTKRRVDMLEEAMVKAKFNCKKLHSDIPQNKRERIIKSFRDADVQYLIATDVASRGLDISGVDNIYNYDIPESVEGYIHRIGRTGRAGEKGYTCLFIDPKNERMLKDIEEFIDKDIKVRTVSIDK